VHKEELELRVFDWGSTCLISRPTTIGGCPLIIAIVAISGIVGIGSLECVKQISTITSYTSSKSICLAISKKIIGLRKIITTPTGPG